MRSPSLRSLVLLVAATLIPGGCSDDDHDRPIGRPEPVPLPETMTVQVTAAQGGTILSGHGHQVLLRAGSLDQDAPVTMQVLAAAPVQPASEDFVAVGHFLSLSLGGASLTQPIRVEVSAPGATLQDHMLAWIVGPYFVPLDTTMENGRFVAELTSTEEAFLPLAAGDQALQLQGDRATVGLVNTSSYQSRPPHQDWPSYNLYVFEQVPQAGGGTKPQFTKVVDQGQVVGTLPALGDQPLMMVHGLGSSIRNQEFVALAGYLTDPGSSTAILGFEYDTLSDVTSTGTFLHQAYDVAAGADTGKVWHHVGHSMGSLVTRQCYEQTGTINAVAASGNQVLTIAGPHLGSRVINVIQGDPNLAQKAVLYLVLNDYLQFTNADGTPCQVTGMEAGFTDLSVGGAFLAGLNTNAAANHPQADYRTLAGTHRGFEFDAVDLLVFGVDSSKWAADGLVDLESANPSATNPAPWDAGIGALQQETLEENHTGIVTVPDGFPTILSLLP